MRQVLREQREQRVQRVQREQRVLQGLLEVADLQVPAELQGQRVQRVHAEQRVLTERRAQQEVRSANTQGFTTPTLSR